MMPWFLLLLPLAYGNFTSQCTNIQERLDLLAWDPKDIYLVLTTEGQGACARECAFRSFCKAWTFVQRTCKLYGEEGTLVPGHVNGGKKIFTGKKSAFGKETLKSCYNNTCNSNEKCILLTSGKQKCIITACNMSSVPPEVLTTIQLVPVGAIRRFHPRLKYDCPDMQYMCLADGTFSSPFPSCSKSISTLGEDRVVYYQYSKLGFMTSLGRSPNLKRSAAGTFCSQKRVSNDKVGKLLHVTSIDVISYVRELTFNQYFFNATVTQGKIIVWVEGRRDPSKGDRVAIMDDGSSYDYITATYLITHPSPAPNEKCLGFDLIDIDPFKLRWLDCELEGQVLCHVRGV